MISEVITLDAYKELRIKICQPFEVVSIELLDGIAEIFGVEMIKNITTTFSSSFAVSTSLGCTVKLTGFVSSISTVSRNSIIDDLHQELQERRINASKSDSKGPIVLLAGPTDVGKSTLTRSLLNYAVRYGSHPLFVDLDVGQSSISIPGTVGILAIDNNSDVVRGYNQENSSIYYFGHKSPGFNFLFYFLLITKLSKTLYNRMSSSKETFYSGAIIDTCGWVTGQGYRAIIHAAQSFDVTTVLVLDDKSLLSRLKTDLNRNIEIKFIDRLKGVVVRNKACRTNRREKLVHEYFYGSDSTFKTNLYNIKFSNINIVKISCVSDKLSSFMYDEPDRHLLVERVEFGIELLNQVLAISYANCIEDVKETSIFGFVCIKNIDFENQTLTILSPKPEPLPNNILVLGDICYDEPHTNKTHST